MGPIQAALDRTAGTVPPQAWFAVSAVFHYLGPCFAVLLFPAVGVLGVAWLRIAAAALLFAPATRPWRRFARAGRHERRLLVAWGACLAVMNCSFYLALAHLPVSLVAAIEFIGSIGLALYGLRTGRNLAALALAAAGVFLLVEIRGSGDWLGLCWAGLNGALFVLYVVLGHRVAQAGAGIESLGSAMAIAFAIVCPIGLVEAARALAHPALILAGIGVGICSSVIPYICDQLAMARLPRASFALLLTLLPACATLIGALVLAQIPSVRDLAGIALVMGGVALHRPAGPDKKRI